MASGEPLEEIAGFASLNHIDLIAFAWQGRFIRGGAPTVTSALQNAGRPVLFLRLPPAAEQAESTGPSLEERRRAG
jgi:hypothetical protein